MSSLQQVDFPVTYIYKFNGKHVDKIEKNVGTLIVIFSAYI